MLAEGLQLARDILSQPALRPFVLAERLPATASRVRKT